MSSRDDFRRASFTEEVMLNMARRQRPVSRVLMSPSHVAPARVRSCEVKLDSKGDDKGKGKGKGKDGGISKQRGVLQNAFCFLRAPNTFQEGTLDFLKGLKYLLRRYLEP